MQQLNYTCKAGRDGMRCRKYAHCDVIDEMASMHVIPAGLLSLGGLGEIQDGSDCATDQSLSCSGAIRAFSCLPQTIQNSGIPLGCTRRSRSYSTTSRPGGLAPTGQTGNGDHNNEDADSLSWVMLCFEKETRILSLTSGSVFRAVTIYLIQSWCGVRNGLLCGASYHSSPIHRDKISRLPRHSVVEIDIQVDSLQNIALSCRTD